MLTEAMRANCGSGFGAVAWRNSGYGSFGGGQRSEQIRNGSRHSLSLSKLAYFMSYAIIQKSIPISTIFPAKGV